jgi:hypothetical protein
LTHDTHFITQAILQAKPGTCLPQLRVFPGTGAYGLLAAQRTDAGGEGLLRQG